MSKFKMTPYDFISKGDSPAYFQLVEVGLMNRDHPEYGGWGGRMVQSAGQPNHWEDSKDLTGLNPYTNKQDASFPQTRWIEALHLDFAARTDWCVKSYELSNHAPTITVIGGNLIKAKTGSSVNIKSKYTDPDENAVQIKYWQYVEAGTCVEKVKIEQQNNASAKIEIPQNAKSGDTIHLIVEGKDNAKKPLIRYQRVIIQVL
jgi:hypothetical protein